MKSILILGDCNSTGNGSMDHIINNDPNHMSEWSIRFNKEYTNLIKWYKAQPNSEPVPEDVPEDQLAEKALNYLTQQERISSWPAYLEDEYKVFNRSLLGNHCGRYRIQLKDHIDKNGKPDLILITDYHPTHIFSEFTVDNHAYNFLSSPSVLDEWTNAKNYPKEIHLVRQTEYINDRDRGEEFLREKTNKYHKELITEIKNNNIPFAHCIFEGEELDNIERHVDLTDITSRYRIKSVDQTVINRKQFRKNIKKLKAEFHQAKIFDIKDVTTGANSKIKSKYQKEIADRVRLLIEDCLADSS